MIKDSKKTMTTKRRDRYSGDFSATDQAQLSRLAKLTSTALDALAQVHIPEYKKKVEELQRTTSPHVSKQ